VRTIIEGAHCFEKSAPGFEVQAYIACFGDERILGSSACYGWERSS
jgi:hypothetical protein